MRNQNSLLDAARRRAPALLLALLLAALPAAGCRQDAKDKLSGPFGDGSGGPSRPAAITTAVALTKVDGSPLGALDYWDTFTLVPGVPPETLPVGFQDAANGILLGLERIVGRIDTPCRYRAALLARDQGYVILASGHRSNNYGLKFYQVNVSGGGAWVNLYCTSLRDNVGVMISGTAAAPEKLTYREVHFILNSIRP